MMGDQHRQNRAGSRIVGTTSGWQGFSRMILGLLVLAVLASCGRVEVKDPKKYYERLYNIPSLPEKTEHPAETLNILCWNDYFPEDLFNVFEEVYGTKIQVEYFTNNEELREKYQQDPGKWDLMMPSDYMVHQFIREGYLMPLERSRLPRMEDLSPGMFELDCDPGLEYFVPVYQSSLGISFEVQHMDGFPRHWDYLDKHTKNPYIYSRIALPDEMRFVFAAALLRLGLDPNTTDPAEIKQAEDYLVSLVRNFGARIVGDEIVDPKVLKNYLLVLTWNGTGAYLLTENPDYRFLIPEDKTILAVDGFVIPKDTKKADTCYLFLDYLMTPRVLALLSETSFYAPASQMAQRYVNSFILNGPSLMIPDIDNCLFVKDIGDAEAMYSAAWERVKAAKPSERLNVIPLQRF